MKDLNAGKMVQSRNHGHVSEDESGYAPTESSDPTSTVFKPSITKPGKRIAQLLAFINDGIDHLKEEVRRKSARRLCHSGHL